MTKSRAERRHHHARMLKKVKKHSMYQDYFWSEDEKLQHQRKVAENRKPCSCWMCGNPRRHQKDKLTMQEKLVQDWKKVSDDWYTVWDDNERG